MTLQTSKQIETAKPGQHKVAGASGLLLFVTPSGKRRFAVRFVVAQIEAFPARRVTETIGFFPGVSLADARRVAVDWREQARRGIDPVALQRASAAAQREAVETTFQAVADRYLESHERNWRNDKHKAQWRMTLREYAFPAIGALQIDQVHGAQIMAAVRPHWQRAPETARRLLRRIAVILDFANIAGLREYPSPSTVAIAKALGVQPKKGNFPAVPWADAPAVFAKLSERSNIGDMALQFGILTAARSSEIRFATWSEIDFDARLWTIPAARMKAGREHVVPLSERAIDLLRPLYEARRHDDGLLFPSPRNRPLSDATLGKSARLIAPGTTQHGWRSTFRDFMGEQSSFDHDTLEACLAHSRGRVHASYQRGSLIEKRREVMALWADYLAGRDVAALWPDRMATAIADISTARRARLVAAPDQTRLTG